MGPYRTPIRPARPKPRLREFPPLPGPGEFAVVFRSHYESPRPLSEFDAARAALQGVGGWRIVFGPAA
jgi:hypothetical protein